MNLAMKDFVFIYLLCESLYPYLWSLFKAGNFLFIIPTAFNFSTLSFYLTS